MRLGVLGWNLYHGRDFPPDRELRTWRSRLLRFDERGATHVQVNRDLLEEFSAVIAAADWDVAALQECPPRWARDLARATGAEAHMELTSRNSLGALRALLARNNPDLMASNEGGSNLTLARPGAGAIAERRVLELRQHPERRVMAFTRLESGVCVANLHASKPGRLASEELPLAAGRALAWAGESPVILAGDYNLRPRDTAAFEALAALGFSTPPEAGSIDHILARGLEVAEPAASWPPEARELAEDGLAIRLSDHAPVTATLDWRRG